MTSHPLADLSAYLDGALEAPEQAALAAHLDVCASCRARLAELRSVRVLMARLPERSPRRSLLPARPRLPRWLGAARWASSLSAAAFALMFVTATVGMPLPGPAAPAAPLAATPVPAPAPQEDMRPAATAADPPETRATFATHSPETEDAALREAQREAEHASALGVLLEPDGRGVPPLVWLVAALAAAAAAIALFRVPARS